METAIIYVFSGTGNTLLTAQMLSKHLETSNIRTTIYSVKAGGSAPPPEGFDYIGFAYPVYAYNMPETFNRFIRELPPAQGKKAFILKTSGEPFKMNNVSSYKLVRMLRKKGFDVLLEQHLLMPYNILFRYPDSLVKQMYLYSDAMCAMLAGRLIGGERATLRFNPLQIFASWLFRIQWPSARLNGMIYSVNKKKCKKCKICVRDCPEANISFKDGRFKFGGRCTMCMRCAMLCPADAINAGLLHFFKVNGAYDFKSVLADAAIRADHVNPHTKGYFRLFRKFFRDADAMLAKYEIDIPVSYSYDLPDSYDSGHSASQ